MINTSLKNDSVTQGGKKRMLSKHVVNKRVELFVYHEIRCLNIKRCRDT